MGELNTRYFLQRCQLWAIPTSEIFRLIELYSERVKRLNRNYEKYIAALKQPYDIWQLNPWPNELVRPALSESKALSGKGKRAILGIAS
jgi:hypothetical protein